MPNHNFWSNPKINETLANLETEQKSIESILRLVDEFYELINESDETMDDSSRAFLAIKLRKVEKLEAELIAVNQNISDLTLKLLLWIGGWKKNQ